VLHPITQYNNCRFLGFKSYSVDSRWTTESWNSQYSWSRTYFLFYLFIEWIQPKDYDTLITMQTNFPFWSLILSYSVSVQIDLTSHISSKIRMILDLLKISVWGDFFQFIFIFVDFSSKSLRIPLSLWRFRCWLRMLSDFQCLFLVSNSVLSVVIWGFMLLIRFDRSFMKWFQFSYKCSRT
jgi:hypothetical protein